MKKLTCMAALAAIVVVVPAAAQLPAPTVVRPLASWSARTGPVPSSSGSYQAVTYLYDDGISENAIGIPCGVATCTSDADLIWGQYFDTNDPLFANSSSDTITRIDVAFGLPPGPTAPPAGTPYTVYVFDDAGNDSDPTNLGGAEFLTSASNVSTAPDSDTYESTAITPTVVNGGFWILCKMAQRMEATPPNPALPGQYPASLDQAIMSLNRAWVTGTVPSNIWIPTAPQSNLAYAPPGWFEMDLLGFPGVWLMRAEGTGTGPSTFCTAKTNLVCGAPAISASGIPSATSSSGFVLSASPARSCKSGILVYNMASGPAVPFQGGTLCIETMSLRRAGSTSSMGTAGGASCDGTFSIDMNAFAMNLWVVPNCDGSPSSIPPNNAAGFLSSVGTSVYTTFWGRDSVATGSFVSNGLRYDVAP